MRQSTKSLVWLVVLFVIALVFAAATFLYLDNYPAFAKGGNRFDLWAWGVFFTVTPVLWAIALAMRRPLLLTFLKVHAALVSALLLVNIAFAPDGSPSAIVAFGLFITILGADAFIARIVWVRMKELQQDNPKFVYLGLTTSIFGGCFVGVQLWSPTLPPRVIAAAETVARDRPYCIEVDGRPARNAGELAGVNMRARNDGGLTLNFHSLLVISAGTDRKYLNWSYKSGRFEPESQHARYALNLDIQVKCTPVAHFARDWH